MRLLLIEDEADLALAVSEHLKMSGYVADHVSTVDEAHAAVYAMAYDLILLDLQLPDVNGLNFLRDLRDRRDLTPVIIVTARDRITERIAGLEAGADDYLVKPYDLNELVARTAAVLRRVENDRAPERQFGTLRIAPSTRRVTVNGNEVSITRKEWAILDRMSRRPDQTFSKADLMDSLYGFTEEVDSNAIEAHVSRLRTKLGKGVVETVHGFGYRMGSG